jgi:hypothetical protein
MCNEYSRRRNASPPQMTCAEAEVVLFAVSLRKYFRTERAHRIDTCAAQVEAEPDAYRNIDRA